MCVMCGPNATCRFECHLYYMSHMDLGTTCGFGYHMSQVGTTCFHVTVDLGITCVSCHMWVWMSHVFYVLCGSRRPACLWTPTSALSLSISISPSSICCRSCLATVFSVSTICSRCRYFCISASCSVASVR